MPKSIRIRTEPGVDRNINVKIDQDFDSLEILSLKLRQEDLSEVEAFSFKQTQIGSVTVGVPHKDKVWLGTFMGNRIASFNLNQE